MRNRQGQGGRLRAELIAAADRILAQTGDVEALSLRGVAREVGIATPSIYLHFPDKRALVHAVLAARFTELGAAVREAVMTASRPSEQLHAGCLAYCRFAMEHPNAYRVLFGRVPAGETAPSQPGGETSPSHPAGETSPPNPLSGAERGGFSSGLLAPEHAPAERMAEGVGSLPVSPLASAAIPDLPAGAAAFSFLVDGVAALMQAGLAPPGDPLRTAIAVWTALHGIVTLRASVPVFPWPPLEQQIDDALRGLVGLRHNAVTAPVPTPE